MGPGQTVGGRYRIVERIGRGGHGEVWRAQQLPLGRDVALKLLLPEAYAGDSPERFAREASLVQSLDHPNTVRLFDFGVDEAGFPFMAFELLRGRTLETEIENGPLAPERVARIATQVLKALMDAHARGIIHRDVKPSNVFLVDFAGEKDFVKVLDFGVARKTVESTTQPKITSDGQMVGTPAYMAPEQVKDQPIGPATDIYSLGLVIAEALSGQMVVVGTSEAQIWMKQASAAPIDLPPRVLASALGPIVVRAVNKDPAQRFASAEEMLRAIETAMSTGSAATDPLATPLPARPPTHPLTPPLTPPHPHPPPLSPPHPLTPLPSSRPSRSFPWWVFALIAASVVIAAVALTVRTRRPRGTVIVNSPIESEPVRDAPPMPPVEAVVVPLGYKPLAEPYLTSSPLLVVHSFPFKNEQNGRRILVHVYDFKTDYLAANEETRRIEEKSDDAVRRRGSRLVVVVAEKRPAEARAVAAQLLP